MYKYKLIAFCKWCQHLPLDKLAKTLKKLGFDGVDLPCRPGSTITHANGSEKLPEAKKIFEDHGLRLERLVTSLREANIETERLLEVIQRLGIKKIRIGGYGIEKEENARIKLDEARRKLLALEKLLAKYGVGGGIQNHSGDALEVNISSCLLMLQDCDPQWIGVQYDPGHLTLSGEGIKVALELLGPYLNSVNFKSPRQDYFIDPVTNRLSYKPVWVPLRDGMLDVPAVLKALQEAGYTDPISIHAEYRTYFYHIDQDIEATNQLVAEDLAYVREVMKL